MYKNLFKIIFRSLWKYKTYTLINVVGMGIGIAALVWAFVLYRHAFSFDSFHPERNTVYRTLVYKKDAEGLRGLAPMPVVASVKNDFSGVKNAARWDGRGLSITSGNGNVFAEDAHFTDPSFFSMFNFPVVAGSNDITNNSAVLITERAARKYFGNDNAIGKTLTFYAGETYALPLTVTGILKDPPNNSTIHFEFITNFENCLNANGSRIADDDWTWFIDAAFFQIPDTANAARIASAMSKYNAVQHRARDDWKVSAYKLITVAENAKLSNVLEVNSFYERPQDSATYGTAVLAILIFLSACLNFSNTTVAQANRRLKEIGIRKVMGSTYTQLMQQLLLESGVVMLAAILISVVMEKWWLPIFNAMFNGITLQANYLSDTGLLLFVVLVLLLSTIMAGAYPAFYISRFNASSIFRGHVKFGGTNLFSRIMLGLQLCIAIITVVAGIAFSNNAAFQRNYNYGYSIENSIGLIFNDSATYDVLKNEISKIPEVTALAGTRHHISFGFRTAMSESEGLKKEIRFMEVGDTYTQTMQLRLSKGRQLDATRESDYKDALLITQKMAADYGWTEDQALGKTVRIDSTNYTVAGVLKDFNMESLYNPIVPVALKLGRKSRYQFLIVQARPQDLTAVYAKCNDVWKRLFPLKPFNAFYQNQVAADTYKTTTSIASIFKWFAIVSILLTATGLFALVSLTTVKKMKEIALRKVVGAAPHHILLLINKNYFWIFVAASALGCAAGWFLSKLLLDLIFRINAGVSVLALAGAAAALFIIAGLITGIKVWQAVKTNPVKLLRTE